MAHDPSQSVQELVEHLEERYALYAINSKDTIELWTEDLRALLDLVASIPSTTPCDDKRIPGIGIIPPSKEQ